MKKCLWLYCFMMKDLIRQPSRWANSLLFFIISFFIFNQLLATRLDQPVIWAFYLLLQNFTIALLLKDVFAADIATTRLHVVHCRPLDLLYYIVSSTLAFTTIIFCMHMMALMFVTGFVNVSIIGCHSDGSLIIWQACSALLLTVVYLFGATLSQGNRLGVFFSLVTVMPLLIPWFLISYTFLVDHNIEAVLAVAALVFLLLPIMLYAQYMVLRSILNA